MKFTDIKDLIDAPELRRILTYCMYNRDPARATARLDQCHTDSRRSLWGITDSARILGVMICVKETDNVFIDAIAVDEQFRNQGIGSTMINGIRKRFTLPVTLETDDDAVEFYRKIGFSAEPFEKYGITRYRCTAPEIPKELKSFLDEKLRLTAYPTKLKTKEMALVYLAGKFERGITYSEKEINEILKAWHTFNDWAVLRRDLFELGFFDRKPDGTLYKLAKQEV